MKSKLFLMLLVVALVLTACATKTEAPKAAEEKATEPPVAEEPVEVIWYVRTEDAEQPWEQDVIIPDFESKHPNIKINLTVVTWDDFDTKM